MAEMKTLGKRGRSPFDEIRHEGENPDGSVFEYWSAREAMVPLGYVLWQNMKSVIERAKTACRNINLPIEGNFIDVNKVSLQRGPKQADTHLSRMGMYLLAMNGDPSKREIAAAQSYFAIQTRRAEIELEAPKIVSPPQLPDRAWAARIRATWQPHLRYMHTTLPDKFTVVTACVTSVLTMEDELIRHNICTNKIDRPDLSIGKRWSNRRKELDLPEATCEAPLFLQEQGIDVHIKTYPHTELGAFNKWFIGEYIPTCYLCYLDNKPEFKPHSPLSRASAADHTSRELTGRPAVLLPRRRDELQKAGGFAPSTLAIPKAKK